MYYANMRQIRTRVLFTLLDVLPVPLADTRSTSVGKDHSTNIFENADLTVTGNSGTDLLRTGGDGELALGLKAMRSSFLGN